MTLSMILGGEKMKKRIHLLYVLHQAVLGAMYAVFGNSAQRKKTYTAKNLHKHTIYQ
jgi:hypothetical protein